MTAWVIPIHGVKDLTFSPFRVTFSDVRSQQGDADPKEVGAGLTLGYYSDLWLSQGPPDKVCGVKIL